MIGVIEFSIISFIIFIIVFIFLRYLHKKGIQFRIKIIFIAIIGGFYGIIFQGANLIEKLNFVRSDELQASAFIFALLYVVLVMLYP